MWYTGVDLYLSIDATHWMGGFRDRVREGNKITYTEPMVADLYF